MGIVEKRSKTLIHLGDWITNFCKDYPNVNKEFVSLIQAQHVYNPWFIEEFVLKALGLWAKKLSTDSFGLILDKYPSLKEDRQPCHVAVIPEENIPLAGIHDLLCVLLTGHHFYCRNLNHENDLLKFLTDFLISIDSRLGENIHWVQRFPKEIDKYLLYAKSDDNTTLKSYFEKKHSLIRRKRISVGIVDSSDTNENLKLLANDIFTFFGITSQSVRKIYFPQGFSLPFFFEALEEYSKLYQYNRYANNYDYHKSVFMMDRIPFFDNGFIVLRESSELQVPLGCLYYEYYQSKDELQPNLRQVETSIQHIVTTVPGFYNSVKPGCSHNYPLWEYCDYKDTIQFLLQ